MRTSVQWVRTSWTKRSRGAPGAARRNAAPVAFVLPPGRPPFVHEVTMREEDGFEPRYEVCDGLPDPRGVLLGEEDGKLRVELVADPHGSPERWRHGLGMLLAPGEWGRWQINYRFAGHSGEWRYRLDTLNIAYGPVPVDAFMGTPARQVDERSRLR